VDEHGDARPWYAPGLYWRVQERRRGRPRREPRKPLWRRMRERGLKWTDELVVGLFVAVIAASFASVALSGGTRHGQGSVLSNPASSGETVTVATPTPGCIAAPIPGSTRRVCAY
jgi:hypothetical protein